MSVRFDTRREALGTHLAQAVPLLALATSFPFLMGAVTDSSPREWAFLPVIALAVRALIILAHAAIARGSALPAHVARGRVLATATVRTASGGGLGVMWVHRDGVVFRQGKQEVQLAADDIARVELHDPGSLAALMGMGSGGFPLRLAGRDGREHRFQVAAPVSLANAIRSVVAAGSSARSAS